MKDNMGKRCLSTVDGIDFRIWEPYPFIEECSKIWYSLKFKGPGIQYEIAICVKTGDVVWFNGPFPCGFSNLNIFCAGLKQELGLGEKVIADCGYRGDANVCTPDDWKDEANKKAMGQL